MNNKSFRPWWWWLNPWLYIQRRDRAYTDALDSLQEISIELNNQKFKKKPWNDHIVANEDDVQQLIKENIVLRNEVRAARTLGDASPLALEYCKQQWLNAKRATDAAKALEAEDDLRHGAD